MDYRMLLEVAEEAARAAGDHAAANTTRRGDAIARAAHDVKLKLDVESQTRAEAVLRRRCPTHAILGEEETGHAAPTAGEILWVVDPIDGTVNFSHGLPFWCTSVAAIQNDRTVAGVVYAPALGECFTAARGAGAFRNGTALRVSTVSDLALSLIATGLDKHLGDSLPPFALFEATSRAVQKTRVMGAAALDICRVAAGQAEGYFESGIYIWDIAAGRLVVEEAGGQCDTIRRFPDNRLCFLATNGLIHKAYRAILEQVMDGRV